MKSKIAKEGHPLPGTMAITIDSTAYPYISAENSDSFFEGM
jgi:hypothetical protein